MMFFTCAFFFMLGMAVGCIGTSNRGRLHESGWQPKGGPDVPPVPKQPMRTGGKPPAKK